jgi:hypothetical protein
LLYFVPDQVWVFNRFIYRDKRVVLRSLWFFRGYSMGYLY